MAQKVTVKHSEIDPEPVEIIAQSIIDIARVMKKMDETRLSRRAIALLIRDSTDLGMGDIFKVLDALRTLEKDYCKPL